MGLRRIKELGHTVRISTSKFLKKSHVHANLYVVFVTDKYHPINFLADMFFAFTLRGLQ